MDVTETRAISIVERFVAEVMSGQRPGSVVELVESEPLRRRVATLRSAFPDLRVSVVRILADGALVAVHLNAAGTHLGSYQGAVPTGRRWSSTCTAIFEIGERGIVDFWLNWDTLDMVEQLRIVKRAAEASA
jgi:predicted ester cyclase